MFFKKFNFCFTPSPSIKNVPPMLLSPISSSRKVPSFLSAVRIVHQNPITSLPSATNDVNTKLIYSPIRTTINFFFRKPATKKKKENENYSPQSIIIISENQISKYTHTDSEITVKGINTLYT